MMQRWAGRWTLALAFGIGFGLAPVAQAQEAAAPIPLFPVSSSPEDAAQALRPVQPAISGPRMETAAPSGITIGGLLDVDPEAIGILDGAAAEPWQRDLGSRLWFGMDRLAVLSLLRSLPQASVSPAVRDLSRQMLLSGAAPMSMSSAPATPGVLTLTRLMVLLQNGKADDVLALAEAMPRSVRNTTMDQVVAQAAWLVGDNPQACALAADGLRQSDLPLWGQMQAVCAAVAGEMDKARLNVGMLDELGAVDAGFRPVADRILGRGKLSLPEVPDDINVFQASALVNVGAKLPESLPLDAQPWLARLAVPQDGPVTDGHLALVETGLARGTLPVELAEKILVRAGFSKKEISAAESLTADAATPRARAVYWQVLYKINAPPARAEIISRMLRSGSTDVTARGAMAALLAKPLAQLVRDSSVAWLAGDAARAALWSGDWALARQWAELAAHNAGAAETTRQAVDSLTVLMAVANADKAAQDRAKAAPQNLQPWLNAVAARGTSAVDVARLRDRAIGLFHALDLPVAQSDGVLALTAPVPAIGETPSSAVAVAADLAAQRGAMGQALGGLAVQWNAVAATRPSGLAAERMVTTALRASSVDWAKRLAVESLLMAGG